MNDAAPINSPIASEPDPDDRAENVENKSGDPFPSAKKVTPAVLSFIPSLLANVDRFGQKKSLATRPRQLNRNAIQLIRIVIAATLDQEMLLEE